MFYCAGAEVVMSRLLWVQWSGHLCGLLKGAAGAATEAVQRAYWSFRTTGAELAWRLLVGWLLLESVVER